MTSFQGELIRDERGREVLRFTTASGVRGIVDPSIPMAALEKMVRKLTRKLQRAGYLADVAGNLKKRPASAHK